MSAPISYDEAEANRRLHEAERVIAQWRYALRSGWVDFPTFRRHVTAALEAYDAATATADEDTAATA